MTKWPEVGVGDVLALQRSPLDPNPTHPYTTVGIKSFGKGLFRYPEVAGAELSKTRFFRLPGACLLASNIQAWEGALAVVTQADADECIASSRFLPYVPLEPNSLDLDFVLAYFMSARGREALRAASPGTAVRNKTLSRKLFEATSIPLPPLDEQRRIASRLGGVAQLVNEIGAHSDSAVVSAALDGATERYIDSLRKCGWHEVAIDQVAEVNPRRAKLDADASVAFVPMAAVDDRTGTIAAAERRTAATVSNGYTQFLAGDVIFARITPCMQNGKCAVFDPSDDVAAGYGSTEFHVLRPREVSAQWLHLWLRRPRFRADATASFTGTAGQQRVPDRFLRSAPILLPPDLRAEREAVSRLSRIADLAEEMRAATERRGALAKAVLPAMLNEVFSGGR